MDQFKRMVKRDLEREEMMQRIEDQANRVRVEVDSLLRQIREGKSESKNGAAT